VIPNKTLRNAQFVGHLPSIQQTLAILVRLLGVSVFQLGTGIDMTSPDLKHLSEWRLLDRRQLNFMNQCAGVL